MSTLLEVNNLKTYFFRKKQPIPAVDGVDFHINKGETVALVGESGSGKSITSLSIMGLVQGSGGKIMDGSIKLEGRDLASFTENEYCKIRGNDVSMIFQEPMTSLNPVLTIGEQITEVLEYHKKMNKKEASKKAVELLELVGFSRAEQVMKEYPHRLSGGQRQRIGIARALTLNPELIIADEPVSALDVSIQAQVINLMEELQEEFNLTYLFISHDLSVVRHISDRVGVMYLGKMMELTEKHELYGNPLHPYTQALLSSVPVTRKKDAVKRERIILKGELPSPANPPKGCVFHTRCPMAKPICKEQIPAFEEAAPGHYVACHLYA
ncbi:ABC transporter ATP-binding protein [Bacillus velezensis]|uniref:ABC transporter ATP-binding protein n=1 Tax=Bacillus velezensis TaxID=492670 RepID=UPI0006A5B8FE|nr:ABC transporter ATP-binding protein [Bacillus velezensis]KOC83304.1 hypothetical protein AKJ10_07700 [Bacillus velezensis]KSW00557.1 hypothetical protein AR442_10440 [Bacillus velezensis]